MIRTGIHAQMAKKLAAQTILWKHPLDCCFQNPFGTSFHEARKARLPQATRVAAIAQIGLLLLLAAGKAETRRIYHDYVISRIEMRSELRPVLASENQRDLARKPTKGLVGGVNQIPCPLEIAGFWRVRSYVGHVFAYLPLVTLLNGTCVRQTHQ